MKWLSNKWLIAVSLLVVLFIIWLMLRESGIEVEAAAVKRGEMNVTIDAEGKTRIHDRFTVTAPVAGRMARLRLHEGDSVAKDFIVTSIDPNPPERPPAPTQSERFVDIYGIKVYAPVAGKILRILARDEQMIAAGMPILEIGNPEKLEIVIDVLSTAATQIKPGAKIMIENWGGTEPLHARVRTIEPQAFTKVSTLGVEEQRVNVVADLLDKSVKLGDNYRIDARIVTWQAENVLKVPAAALFRQGEKWHAFVVENGTARLREVRIDHQNNTDAEVIEGLTENEIVILHPSNQIGDGVKVSMN